MLKNTGNSYGMVAKGFHWILLALSVFGHVAAAMFHHFIKKDDVLKNMTAGSRT